MKVHFIGIGGIGVSALAQYFLAKGHEVSGSDLVSSEITDALKKKGAKIFTGQHQAKNLPKNVNLVIYSPAIPKTNPELQKVLKIKNLPTVHTQKLKIKVLSYPEALGELTKKYFTIAVCGSHGKSTVAAMIGILLTKAGFEPTVIIGTKVKEFGDSNCRVGKSKYLVIEADEHFASFLNYWPKIIVLTTLESDHLDFYKNFKNYVLAFKKFISHLPKDGILVANKDDKNIQKIIKKYRGMSSVYSFKQAEAKKLRKILKVPGEHNVANALAALAVARALKIPDKTALRALSEYKGAWRRFEEHDLKIKNLKLKIISDYGHHPTQIKATLKAAREKFPNKKIWLVYQLHQYQRTFYLFNDFVKVFKNALRSTQGKPLVDKIIITDIFDVAGRESKAIKKKVSSEKLVKAINKPSVIYLPQRKIVEFLKKNLRGREVVIIMGAGDIYKLVDLLIPKQK